ncbi:hypothetical protein BHE74_00041265 [Ensete ventricosum]|nr:hypothetical protein BHE74_00041265 [Ensete ventricosum]
MRTARYQAVLSNPKSSRAGMRRHLVPRRETRRRLFPARENEVSPRSPAALFSLEARRALRRVIQKYSGVALSLPPDNGKKGYGLVTVHKIASFFEVLDDMNDPMTAVESEQPMAMESVGQQYVLSSGLLLMWLLICSTQVENMGRVNYGKYIFDRKVILELHAPNPGLTINLVKKPDFTCGSKQHQK